MFNGLLIHPATGAALEAYAQNPPHALLLIGPTHIGKLTLAKAWAKQVANGSVAQIIEPDEKGSIGIETIRELYQAARSKSRGSQAIIIDHAETMGVEAQNALLKLLEEPRPGLCFILTSPHLNALLPTIVSRIQQVRVRPLAAEALQAWLPALAGKDQLLFIAQGRPALLAALSSGAEAFQALRNTMQRAKDLLAAKPYERFAQVGRIAADRNECIALLEAMLQITSLQLTKNQQTDRWLQISEALESALLALSRNANAKAQLLKLFAAY
ncbi:MAG TPA: AAA family ATPase [Candidatus Acidoferrum sp.]|nr:AAA family ATPase [Candidatus Acidoferrum sp.]